MQVNAQLQPVDLRTRGDIIQWAMAFNFIFVSFDRGKLFWERDSILTIKPLKVEIPWRKLHKVFPPRFWSSFLLMNEVFHWNWQKTDH